MVSKSLYATMKATSGNEDFVTKAISDYADKVRQEAGCVRFEVYKLEDGTIHVEETYKDDAAFQTHIGTAYGKAFNESIKDKVVGGGSNCVFLTPVHTTL